MSCRQSGGSKSTNPAIGPIAEARLPALRATAALTRLPLRPSGVVFDFDGVFTDDHVTVDEHGTEAVSCSRRDGLGIGLLADLKLPLLVLSSEQNPVVHARCTKLRLPCRSGERQKLPALQAWCKEQGLNPADVVYVGNDVNDLACLRAVGCGVAVADAHPAVRDAARLVLEAAGGRGAVREIADLVVARIRAVYAEAPGSAIGPVQEGRR